jgi:hypothetical protein
MGNSPVELDAGPSRFIQSGIEWKYEEYQLAPADWLRTKCEKIKKLIMRKIVWSAAVKIFCFVHLCFLTRAPRIIGNAKHAECKSMLIKKKDATEVFVKV